jgi:hypothetical protein
VGLYLLGRLSERFGDELNTRQVSEPDISLAQDFSLFAHVLILDALSTTGDAPYELITLNALPSVSSASHVIDWGAILGACGKLYGQAPQVRFLGIRAANFGYSEIISGACILNADKAFDFVIKELSVL